MTVALKKKKKKILHMTLAAKEQYIYLGEYMLW